MGAVGAAANSSSKVSTMRLCAAVSPASADQSVTRRINSRNRGLTSRICGERAMHGRAVRAASGQPCGLQRRQLPHPVRQEQRDPAFGLVKQLRAAMRVPIRGVGAGIDGQPDNGANGAIGIQDGFWRVMRHVGLTMFYGETA
ncbi:hypothetical protein G6F40_015136 [Rhizopus arrhizus]|nr:hypothetical protein G6F40_015136 [Rhizopus arrhizus]KAG1243132.1 hypothetical protein G6F68_015920 [Rhizopus microsporus]